MEVRTIPPETLIGLRDHIAEGEIEGEAYSITMMMMPPSGITVEFEKKKYLLTWDALLSEVYEHHKQEVAGGN